MHRTDPNTLKHRIFFFAGGDYQEGNGNAFTANFIGYLTEILDHRFSVISGIYHPSPLMNVIWALNRAQEPERLPHRNRIIASSVRQIMADPHVPGSQLTIVSSSYGSVVAAQAACHLAERRMNQKVQVYPFNLALGASMVAKDSGLYQKLLEYQRQGIIGTIIYDELQDEGDNSNGLGGKSRLGAYLNALGICFPILSMKHRGPSFLNTHPVKGHLHRVRAQSKQKAKDFVKTILIDYRLAGDEVKQKAELKIR